MNPKVCKAILLTLAAMNLTNKTAEALFQSENPYRIVRTRARAPWEDGMEREARCRLPGRSRRY